jgi:soluble lytic murein transglycosylase-like protein
MSKDTTKDLEEQKWPFRVNRTTVERIRRYDSIIERLGIEKKLNPNLIRGIIAVESRGMAHASAKSGYKGLMQAGKNEDQYQPEVSIQTGINKYKIFERSMIRELKKYGMDFNEVSDKGKIGMCMVAYNAGPGTVQKAMQYASEAGDVKKWLNPEHFLRALIHYKSHSVTTALHQGLKRMSGENLARELSQLPGMKMNLAAIKEKFSVKNKWKTEGLKKAIINHVSKERIQLGGKDLSYSKILVQASKWLLYSVNFKYRNLRTSYVDNVLHYKRYFDNVHTDVRTKEIENVTFFKEKVLRTGSERREAIVHMQEGIMEIEANEGASGEAPFYERPDLSWVPAHSPIITSAAKDYGVDPDLVKAIMWVETTHGYYDIVKVASGSEKSVLPMNIHAEYWIDLGKTREQLKNIRTNVRLGVYILSEIAHRLKSPSVAKIATLYNNLSADKVSDYGARVTRVYEEKPWKNPVSSETQGVIWKIGEQLVPAGRKINEMMNARAQIGRVLLSQPEKRMSFQELLRWTLKDQPDLFNHLEKQIQNTQNFNDSQGFSVDFVRWLESLFGLAYSKQSESGKFSEDLTRALELWQNSCGLKVDGKVAWKGDTFQSLGTLRFEPLEGKYKGKEGREILPARASVDEKYDFFKRLIISNYGVFKESPGTVNVVGIRGLSDGKQVSNVLRGSGLVDTIHNDTLFLVGQDEKGNKFVKEYPSSVDPGGQNREKPTAHLRDGTYLYKMGLHPGRHHPELIKKLSSYAAQLKTSSDPEEKKMGNSIEVHDDLRYTALRGVSKQTVLRDFNKNKKLEPYEEHLGDFGINIHLSDIIQGKPWSIGCQVISGKTASDTIKNYVDFIGKINQSSNRNEIPYTLIDASKVNAMETWMKFDAGEIIFQGTEKLLQIRDKLQHYLLQSADSLHKWIEQHPKKAELPRIPETTGISGREIKEGKTPGEEKRILPYIRDEKYQTRKKEQERVQREKKLGDSK